MENVTPEEYLKNIVSQNTDAIRNIGHILKNALENGSDPTQEKIMEAVKKQFPARDHEDEDKDKEWLNKLWKLASQKYLDQQGGTMSIGQILRTDH